MASARQDPNLGGRKQMTEMGDDFAESQLA